MAKQLLTERENPFPFKQIGDSTLVESVVDGNPVRVVRATGVFQNWLRENSNKRIYPKSIWDRVLKEGSPFMQRVKERGVLGMIEHPEDGQTNLRLVSHVITEVRYATPEEIASSNGDIVEGDILGTYETLPYGDGQYLAGLHNAKVSFGISSRGQGNVVERNGKSIVEDDYDLETWDVVYNPSVKHARPKPVQESDKDKGKDGKLTESGDKKPLKEGDGQPGCDLPVETEEDLRDALTMAGFTSEDGITFVKGDYTITPSQDGYSISLAPNGWAAGSNPTIKASPAEVWEFIASNDGLHEGFNPGLLFKSRALARHRKEKGKPDEKEEIAESHPPTNMTKLDELRSIKGGIIRLIQTETKKLRPSDKAAILEEITSSRMKIDSIIAEDKSLTTEGQKLLRRLQEFEEVVDAEEAPPAPPTPGGEGADDAAALEAADAPLPEEAKEVLSKAADMLRDLGGDSEEAQQTAEELQALCAADGGTCGGEEDPDTDFVDDIPVVESKTKAISFVKRYRTLEAIHKATTISASRLLERVRSGKAKGITESTARDKELKEYKEAATELAEMYNRDMIKLNLDLLETKQPELFAKHAEALKEHKVFKKFKEALDALTKTPAQMAESDKDKNKKPLTESDKDKDKGKLTESVHPALAMVNMARRK